jgi:hypothetical protein
MTNKHDPLTAHRARVAAAEHELLGARDAMRSRAKALKIPTARLFGDCAFVSRESAALWVKDARREMREEMRVESRINIELTAKLARNAARREAGVQTAAERAEDAERARLGAAMQNTLKNAKLYETDPTKCDASYLEMRRKLDMVGKLSKLCKSQGLKFSEVFGPGSLATPSSMAMAERLVAGGKARGSEVADDPEDVARAIVRAGAKRRSETEESAPFLRVVRDDEQPTVATPEAILLAGKRRRGEI